MTSINSCPGQYHITVKKYPSGKQAVRPFWTTQYALLDSTTRKPILQSPVQTTPPFFLNRPGYIFKLFNRYVAKITLSFRRHDLDHGLAANAGQTSFQEFITFVIHTVLNYEREEFKKVPVTLGAVFNKNAPVPQTSYGTSSASITLLRNPINSFYPMYADQFEGAREDVLQYFDSHPGALERLRREAAAIHTDSDDSRENYEATLSVEASQDLYNIMKCLIHRNLETQWQKRPLHTFGEPESPEELMDPVPGWVGIRDLNHVVMGIIMKPVDMLRLTLTLLSIQKGSNKPYAEPVKHL